MPAVGAFMGGILVLLAMSCAAAPVQVAIGLEPGVHIDPGSPAAKEYALPLSQARQTDTGASPGRSAASAPFGAGIKPPGAGGSSHSGAGAATAGGGGSGGAVAQKTLLSAVLGASSSRAGSAGSGDSFLSLLAGGAAILVLGGFGGTVLRRSRDASPGMIDRR